MISKDKLRLAGSYALVMIGMVLICSYLATVGVLPINAGKPNTDKEFESSAPVTSMPPKVFEIPEDEILDYNIFPKELGTRERREYKTGDMRLVIPKLEVDVPIVDNVDEKALTNGPGLYEQAHLPGTGNRNVSIAGHRDIHGSHFYYIDKMTDGDYFYLVWDNTVYRYTYKDTTIVASNDWGPIAFQGFSCLTLTSCDPIGTSRNRIIVRGELSQRVPYADSYIFEETYSGK